MDVLFSLAAAAGSVATLAGAVFMGRKSVKPTERVVYGATDPDWVAPPKDADGNMHHHQALHQGPEGWYCACGLHYHKFVLVIKDPDGVPEDTIESLCQCGRARGFLDTWQDL